jgi:hypothetical protein
MKFNLKSEIDVIRFQERVNYHLVKKTRNVELTEKRTVRQNSYLHLLIGWFAIESGNTIDYVKSKYYKELVNPEIFVKEKDDKFLGKTIVLKSSADLTTSEMNNSIERFKNWSSQEAGIYLPDANENEFLKHIQEEIERNKIWI